MNRIESIMTPAEHEALLRRAVVRFPKVPIFLDALVRCRELESAKDEGPQASEKPA